MDRQPRVHVAGVGWIAQHEPESHRLNWWHRNRDEVLRDFAIAFLVIAVGIFWDLRQQARSLQLTQDLAATAEALENTRFVRSLSSRDEPRPFRGMYLDGANLSGLDLSCRVSGRESTCAVFDEAGLKSATLVGTNLSGAFLIRADLQDANLNAAFLDRAFLSEADLTGASFVLTSMRGASLSGALLTGARFLDADLRGANLAGAIGLSITDGGVCFDQDTIWPDDFNAPAQPVCPERGGGPGPLGEPVA